MISGKNKNDQNKDFYISFQHLLNIIFVLILTIICLVTFILFEPSIRSCFKNFNKDSSTSIQPYVEKKNAITDELTTFWVPEDINSIKNPTLKARVEYGKELISHTSKYLGPKGSVMQISNGMNCQNCHLVSGTKSWGNNYGSVKSTYPKLRARSGQIEDVKKRINDCFERSLNGKALALNSKEMIAIKSYIEFIGKNVKKGEKAIASGIFDLPFLSRAIDPIKGKALYENKCANCHQMNGEGLMDISQLEYTYPPLWGNNSYNIGAGLFRMGRFAGYIKYNMPYGVSYPNSQLSDEEAWDIAAYVNSQPRPSKDLSKDWPKLKGKPYDHPFGPFADSFSENEHKYGPFKPIVAEKKKIDKK